MKKLSYLLAFVFIFNVQSTQADPAGQCESAFKQQAVFRRILEASWMKKVAKFFRISAEQPIMNQGKRGFCWLYSTFANLLQRRMQRTGIDPKITIYYPSYFHWMEQAVKAATQIDSTGVEEGGDFFGALDIFRKHGAVTLEKWIAMGGNTDIELPQKDVLETPQINALVQQSHAKKAALTNWFKPEIAMNATDENVAAAYTKFYDNKSQVNALKRLIEEKTSLIRKNKPTAFTADMLKKMRTLVDAKENPNTVFNGTEMKAVFDALNTDITESMKTLFNQIYFNQDSNPMETQLNVEEAKKFAHEIFPELREKEIYIHLSDDHDQKPQMDPEVGLVLSIKDALKLMGLVVKANVPTVMVYDHQGQFVDALDPANPANQGTMSVQRLRYSPDKIYVSRMDRKIPQVRWERGGHLVDIQGAYFDANENLLAMEIHNSWGTTYGQEGEFIADLSYLGAFAEYFGLFTKDLDRPEIQELLGPEIMNKIRRFHVKKTTNE